MAVQSSGAISLQDIINEFGGETNPVIQDYYRGGSYVPDSGTNSGIPTTGAIEFSDFYSASAQLGAFSPAGPLTRGGASPNQSFASDTVTCVIQGGPIDIAISGTATDAAARKNGGPYLTTTQSYNNGDTIRLAGKSSSSLGVTRTVRATYQDGTGNQLIFSITTPFV